MIRNGKKHIMWRRINIEVSFKSGVTLILIEWKLEVKLETIAEGTSIGVTENMI